MIIAHNLHKAILVIRENRFIGIVKLIPSGDEHRCHIMNPGRMIHFLIPGANLLVEYTDDPKRKTQYSLKYVVTPTTLILIDSQQPNKIFKEALEQKNKNITIPQFISAKTIESEKIYGDGHSRIDIRLDNSIFIEIKSTNYARGNLTLFPDAPSKRAVKHVKELIGVVKDKTKEAWIVFLAQREDVDMISPFEEIDPDFTSILKIADEKGVQLRGYKLVFKKGGLEAILGKEIPVKL